MAELQREDIWYWMSEFYLDTEHAPAHLLGIARVLAGSVLSVENLEIS